MRYLVIADIHGNLEALISVLNKATGSYSEVLCLGDSVDYGPDSIACINVLRNLTCHKRIISGNHDASLFGYCRPSVTSHGAVSRKLTESQLERNFIALHFLRYLVPSETFEDFGNKIMLLHGSIDDFYWGNLNNFDSSRFHLYGDVNFLAHTHIPSKLESRGKLFINPGSVGQPRDGNNSASYCIFDSEKLTFDFHRAEYDIELTQSKLKKLGYPKNLIERLYRGV